MRGKYFEDFSVGEVLVTRGRTVTEADIMQYGGLSWDVQREHTNIEFARKGPFGGRVAQQQLGILVSYGLLAHSQVLDGTVVSVLRFGWNFFNPVKVGDTLRLKMTTKEKRDVVADASGLIVFELETINQRNHTVNRSLYSTLVARRAGQGQEDPKDRPRCPYVFKSLSDLEGGNADPREVAGDSGTEAIPTGSQSLSDQVPLRSQEAKVVGRGKYYEEFELGEDLVTDARTVAEADVVNYTALSWDTDPLHTDAEFGRSSTYGGLLAPLLLPVVFANGLGATLGYLAGTNRGALGGWWEFTSPVRVGDTLHFRQVVTGKMDAKDPDTGIVTYSMSMVNQERTVVTRGQRSALVARLPSEEPRPWSFSFGTVQDLAKSEQS